VLHPLLFSAVLPALLLGERRLFCVMLLLAPFFVVPLVLLVDAVLVLAVLLE
jgi:hypothetical protein